MSYFGLKYFRKVVRYGNMLDRNENKFMVKPSLIESAGVGCFSLSKIKKGERINKSLKEMFDFLKMEDIHDEYLKYCILLPNNHYLSPKNFLKMNVFWYINHSKNPNLKFEKNALTTLRDIEVGEELYLYYSDLLTHPKNKLWVKPEDI